MSNKTDFRPKLIKGDGNRHFILNQDYILILNMYAPNAREATFVKEKKIANAQITHHSSHIDSGRPMDRSPTYELNRNNGVNRCYKTNRPNISTEQFIQIEKKYQAGNLLIFVISNSFMSHLLVTPV